MPFSDYIKAGWNPSNGSYNSSNTRNKYLSSRISSSNHNNRPRLRPQRIRKTSGKY